MQLLSQSVKWNRIEAHYLEVAIEVAVMTKFTDTFIKNLKPATTKYYKREANGFAIKVWPTGTKTWAYIYTINGNRRELKLGKYPSMTLLDARIKYNKAFDLCKSGSDPGDIEHQQKEEQKLAPTVENLIGRYLNEFAKPKKKTWKEDERILHKDVMPLLGKKKAKDVTRTDILAMIDEIKHRGAAITLNTFKITRRMFNFALKRGIVKNSPCIGFEIGDELEGVPSRERNLSENEIKTLWHGLDKAGISTRVVRALKLILVTCQRPGEVITMHRDQIDGRWWEFMAKETKVTRDIPRLQRIYLSDLAFELIGDNDGYIFPSPRPKTINKGTTEETVVEVPITERALAYAIRRNIKGYTRRKPLTDPKADNIPKMVRVNENKKLDMDHFVPHDLRRTAATIISHLGFSDEILDAVLAHQKHGIIRTYNRNKYDPEKQAAMLSWEHKLNNLISGQDSETIISNVAAEHK
jgi:integrase